MPRAAAALVALVLPVAAAATLAAPASRARAAPLAALVPADDARRAIAIGRAGEVYEPDGKGAWIHRLPCTTARPIAAAGRAGATVVALGDGAIFRLAAGGWSAIRLVQRGKAILGDGPRALAAVGRQLFALDALTRGEPTRLIQAPSPIVAIGAGAAIVLATETGAFRVAGAKLVALPAAVSAALGAAPGAAIARPRLISDRWAITDRGAIDLATGRLAPWPPGLAIAVAAAAPAAALAAVAVGPGGLELLTLTPAGRLARDPLGATGTAVGVAVDRAGRAAVALADGRIALRTRDGWTTTTAVDEPAADRPGAAPATSG